MFFVDISYFWILWKQATLRFYGKYKYIQGRAATANLSQAKSNILPWFFLTGYFL